MRHILGSLMAFGALFTYYYGDGENKESIEAMVQESAAEYQREFGSPVSANNVIAFLRARGIGKTDNLGVFLTEEGVTYYNPSPRFPHEPKTLRFPREQISNVRFMGQTIYINGRDGSQLHIRVDNAMYAKYFKDRLRELETE